MQGPGNSTGVGSVPPSRAESAFRDVCTCLFQAILYHNASGQKRLEIHDRPDRFEVYQEGLIFPSLRLTLDSRKEEIRYFHPARSPKESTVEGAIVPGPREHLLVIDGAGIAHRIGCDDLARYLLRPALTDR